MKTIGIDTNDFLVYEGSGFWGHGYWPTPTILPAFILSSFDKIKLDHRIDLLSQPYIFIDEGYDPTSRVRKGRIYEKWEGQPNQWHVSPHPAKNQSVTTYSAQETKSLATFREFNFFSKIQNQNITCPCILLGTKDHYTIWSVVDVETAISGEAILFIKSRKVIGALPKICYELINDENDRTAIEEKIRLLSLDISHSAPDSVIDRCREAASAILNTFLISNGLMDKARDLGQLEAILRDSAKMHIVANLVAALAKFHSRTKHVEQTNRKTRAVSEQDAEFSIQALGIILVEIGWGYW